MTPKERLLTALNRGKPDRLPVSIHQWQAYHLDQYMGGISDLDAFRLTGLDAQIQYVEEMDQFWVIDPDLDRFNTKTWRDIPVVINRDPDQRIVHHTIDTPEGTLTYKTESNRKTTWVTEYLIKHDEDIELIRKYMPARRLALEPVAKRYEEVGDDGILRGYVWGDQAGCWQHAACLYDITALIYATFEKPDWVHALMKILLDKKLTFIESMKGAKFDLIETGGGSASSTVISPALFEEFCLPYDRQMHDALHDLGFLISYHTCGGTVGIEELIIQTGTDVSETLAPISVGGNQEPWDFKRKVGDRLAVIGGVDQFSTLGEGPVEKIQQNVRELFEKVGPNGGYVCAASDHFFDCPPEHLVAFALAARECRY